MFPSEPFIDHSKRFHSAHEIEAEIDKIIKSAQHKCREAESYDMEIRAIQLRDNPGEAWMIEEKTINAARLRKHADTLLRVRCSWLKAKLAEFKTMTLPGVDMGDGSIPRNRGAMR